MPGARILLIEDDEVLCNLVKRNLEMRQHEVSIGVDAKSALALLRTHSFDLVLLDINLPDQTGWEILRIVRKENLLHPFGPETGSEPVLPVVVLSAVRVSPSRLTEFHPLAYLPKPFPMEALLRLAAEAGERKEKNASADQSNAGHAPFHPSPEEELHA